MAVELEISGIPAPQGSKTGFYNEKIGRVQMTNGATNSPGRLKLDAWREAVAHACAAHLDEHPAAPMPGPLAITIRFRFPPVRSDRYRFWHATKPDIDKLVRSTFDALKLGALIADDSAVCKLTTVKRYINDSETAGASILVESLVNEEQQIRETRKERAAAARRAPVLQTEALPL